MNQTSQIIALIEQRAGLLLHEQHRAIDAQRAIASTVAELGLADENALYAQLQRQDCLDAIWQTILQKLTIGETYFFRNQAHFYALRHEILPQMIARKRERNQRWLRIWSAGCATGEEIYSMAILLRELLPDFKDWLIYLVGTDINETYLEHARQGIYRINSFRGETPKTLRADWFTTHGSTYKLDTSVRNMVVFHPLNLVTDTFPTPNAALQSMDIILCQNVTIYFERAVTEGIQEKLVNTLTEDGWLILGHSEPLFIKTPHLAVRQFPNAMMFQRQPVQIIQPPAPAPVLKLPKAEPVKPRPAAKPVQKKETVEEISQKARLAADRQSWDEALALLDKLFHLQPLYEYTHYLRALIYMDKSDYQKALISVRQAIYCNSNFILAHYTLGELYRQLGHHAQAKNEWEITKKLLAHLPPESLVPYSMDLSVEMLSGLLEVHQ